MTKLIRMLAGKIVTDMQVVNPEDVRNCGTCLFIKHGKHIVEICFGNTQWKTLKSNFCSILVRDTNGSPMCVGLGQNDVMR